MWSGPGGPRRPWLNSPTAGSASAASSTTNSGHTSIVDGDDAQSPTLERAGTIMPCNTGVAVFSDGTIVTAAQTESGESLQILQP